MLEDGGSWILAGRVDALPPGGQLVVEVRGERIVLVNLAGQIYAFSGRCPHEGGPLQEGQLWGDEIECPWHHYLYEIRSGENVYPRRVYPADMPELQAALAPLRRFPVRQEGTDILVEIPP